MLTSHIHLIKQSSFFILLEIFTRMLSMFL